MKLDTALYARLLREAADNPPPTPGHRPAHLPRRPEPALAQRPAARHRGARAPPPALRRDRRGALRLPANKFFIVRVWA